MAVRPTAAVRLGYDAASRCDGYGSHAYCDPRGYTASALGPLRNRAVPYRVGVGEMEFLTGGAPTADINEYPDGTMAFNPTVGSHCLTPISTLRKWLPQLKCYRKLEMSMAPRSWATGVLTFREKALANWPEEMSHSTYGECDFDAQRTDETQGPQQPAG